MGNFNNDTHLDVVVIDNGSNDVNVLLQYNRGALRYSMSMISGDASRLRCAVAADINNDNRMDLVVANYATNNIGILLGYENGTFEKQKLLNTGLASHPSSITIADFNGDSRAWISLSRTMLIRPSICFLEID